LAPIALIPPLQLDIGHHLPVPALLSKADGRDLRVDYRWGGGDSGRMRGSATS
jgi:hypothetical protein